MRITYNEASCIGSGICESVAADVFRIGDDGLMELVAKQVGDERLDEIELAVSRCPTGAITLAIEH